MSKKRLNIILGIIFAILLIFTLYSRTGAKKYEVKSFSGKTYQEVAEWADRFSVPSEKVIYNYVFSETVPENTVISQSMKEGSYITGQNALVITVSKGIDPDQKYELIDFTGMKQDEIESWLKSNGFENYEFVTRIDEELEEFSFMASDPKAGARIKKNELVRVLICAHDHSTTASFPDFTGQTVSEIQEWADTNDITVNYIYYYDAAAEGSFLFSDITPGTEISKGDTVSVAVSSGPGY